jgi:hypothetical protein
MRQQPIIDALDKLGFVQRGGVLEYAALQSVPGNLPAAFVVPQVESAGPNRLGTGATDQRVLWSFAVVVILAAGARRPEAVSEQLEDLTAKVKATLAGWKHPDASGPTEFTDGQLVGAGAGAVSWAVRFRCPYHLRKVN